ncbi:hypothetical protein EG346_22000 [Chryseobacterium carnipullorum]|uniref:Uncharacterized protein n=1 Tax=Chryseobacterium carnipullorum TaxID=1124835 RepID=A0A376E4N8_CHRCU|nr:hypothetical protein [Chryseobacterium carnipullorum]AZA50682.1 hypothetical protein EG346_22000 [Chryseobacterium carnipullorum]AZA65549.1 hypothetical protein EG345_13095 [Chryseobacterium carnipullorum]STD01352.1 Uncharacterised protein [Chryseobacterium carnipullorum]
MKPLILDYKIIRPELKFATKYKYDHFESLSVVVFNGKKVPLISTPADIIVNLNTVTKVKSEADSSPVSFDLTTRTKIGGEKDDYHFDYVMYTTKTLVKLENDDTRTPYNQ